MDTTSGEVNQHWGCCIKDARGNAAHLTLDDQRATEGCVKRAYAECLLKKAKHWDAMSAKRDRDVVAALRSSASRPVRHSPPKPKREPKKPNLASRVKIMVWAIETCGQDKAQDAFDRAMKSLEP